MRDQITMEKAVRTPTTDRNWQAEQATGWALQGSTTPDPADGGRDVAAFEEMVGRCEDGAYLLAMQLVRSESAAQEILQQTFLSAWQNMQRFAGVIQFSDWVYRTVGKAALRHLNSTSCGGEASAGDRLPSIRTSPKFWIRLRAGEESDWSLLPTDQLGSEDLYRHVRKTVDALPIELRTMFILCDSAAMSVEDGAEILDLPVATAKKNLQAARLAVRAAIGDHFSHGVHDRASTSVHAGIDNRLLSEASLTET